MGKRKPEPPPTCKGWNYHVVPFCSDRCVMCGWRKYPQGSSEASQ